MIVKMKIIIDNCTKCYYHFYDNDNNDDDDDDNY